MTTAAGAGRDGAEPSTSPAGADHPERPDMLDLRLVPVALALWLGALAGVALPRWAGLLVCAPAVVAAAIVVALPGRSERPRSVPSAGRRAVDASTGSPCAAHADS
ncbi:competence protein ComEC, partial [Jiangella asiatica]